MRKIVRPLIGFGLVVFVVVSGSATAQSPIAAQATGPCALLKIDDIQPLAPNTKITDGVATSYDLGYSACRYTWGAGLDHYTLDVTVGDASRMFSDLRPEMVKPALQAMIAAGTADALIPDLGDAAIFKADSPVYVCASAYLKGRILQVHLDGMDARDKKDQTIALLKTAASRFQERGL
jgi:hypothetical protein